MREAIFARKPAFFPFVSAEIFFEAEAGADLEGLNDLELDLESELDALLSV